MKRLIAAVSFAVLSAPVFAVEIGAPYDQSLVDRALPDVQNPVVEEATGGSTAAPSSVWATGVWADDYAFIAPAQ